jgi:hypothetical protein
MRRFATDVFTKTSPTYASPALTNVTGKTSPYSSPSPSPLVVGWTGVTHFRYRACVRGVFRRCTSVVFMLAVSTA